MAIDRDGYLWVGTQDGAASYNGRVWRTVNLPTRASSNWVTTICAASDGSILFGTNGAGICILRDGAWTVIDPSNAPLRDGFIYQIVESPDGSLPTFWVAGGAGLFQLEGAALIPTDVPDGLLRGDVSSVLETSDRSGAIELWVGHAGGIALRRNGIWSGLTAATGFPADNAYCLSAGVDEHGDRTIWAGTSAGLVRFAGGRWQRVSGDDHQGGPGATTIYSVLETRDPNAVWVGTPSGLWRLEGGVWHLRSTDSGLPDNSVISLFELPNTSGVHAILAGTLSGGLARISTSGWRSVTDRSGLPDNHVYSFAETLGSDGDSSFYIGTYAGLARRERDRWTVLRKGSGLPDDKINCLLATKDGLWAGTFGGLAYLRGGRWSVVDSHSGLPNDTVRCLLATTGASGAPILWVGTYGGLARQEAGAWSTVDTTSGLPNDQVMALARTVTRAGEESIWAGTLGGGLARLVRGQWTVVDASSGLPNDMIRCVREVDSPDGSRRLWVGTLGGAATLDLDDEAAGWRVVSDATVPALPNNVVYDVRADDQGRVYLLTNKGVARLTARTATEDDPSPYALYNFTTEDGLPSNECNGGAAMVDRLGRIWIGTTGGAAMLDPAEERSVPASRLRIERTLVNGGALGQSSDPHALPTWPSLEGTRLSYDRNDLVFESTLLSFYKESATEYRSQLVGLESAPTAWGSDATRTFSRLPAGDYVFRVWARNYAGSVTGPLDVSFTVGVAPWRTWWAYTIYGLAILGLAYAGVRLRVQSYERRTRRLEEKVADRTRELDAKNHELAEAVARALDSEHAATEANRAKSVFLASMSHELRTPLNAVLGFVQLMQRTARPDSRDREYLSVITRSGEHLLGLINDVLSISKIESGKVELAPSAFSLDGTLRGVVDVFASRAALKGLVLRLEVAGDVPAFVLGDEGKLRQILINLVGNAVKFTTAGAVVLRCEWRSGRATFDVSDTGPGISESEMDGLFEPFVQTASGRAAAEGTGLGLTITRTFVRMMGGDIRVESRVRHVGHLGPGTTFRFDVSLPEASAPSSENARLVTRLADDETSRRVLVVDDKWENRLLLVDLLGAIGFETREAADGAAALDVFEQWRPDVVLMDVRMPTFDGCAATREIRRREEDDGRRRAVVIALSASVFAQDRQAILDAECDAFLPKPIQTAQLLDAIRRLARVRYEYAVSADDTVPDAAVAAEMVRKLSLALERLPYTLLERLRAAVDAGAVADAAGIVGEIAEREPEAGQALAALLKMYRLDDVAGAVEHATRSRRPQQPTDAKT